MALALAGGSLGITQRRSSIINSRQSTGLRLQRGGLLPARAFDEGAAQVRRLVDRDRKELNLDDLEATFAEPSNPTAPATPTSAAEADGASTLSDSPAATRRINLSAADKTPVSPFGPSSSSSTPPPARSPFAAGGAAPVRSPFAEPAGLSPNMPTPKPDTAPWWTKITLTQVVITASFTTIIALMISTFFFVLGTGAIHFNDQ